jgi:RND family efflux transporter MFP subunit
MAERTGCVKKYIYVAVAAALVLIGYLVVNAIFTPSYDIPTARVEKGEFVIALNENGEIDAKNAVTLSAPRIRGLQITWLAPEGSIVEKGDAIIRFDATQQTAELAEHESDLKIKRAALERARKEYTIQEKQLKLDLEKARRSYDEKKHEAPRIAEEARLELEVAELNFNAKLEQLKGDVEKFEVEVARAEDKVRLARRELDQMTMYAPLPGLVVYLSIWKGGSQGKVQEGDSPWPGQGLVNIPDLSEMIVNTTVSEVDANKVDTGQEVIVKLDALPDREYVGRVISKSTLARKKDYSSRINVFDVEVLITDNDEQLKPGMSASCRIVVQRIPEVVSVPLEAVFERDGQTVVFMENKKKREVTVGRRNDMSIEIVEGLAGGEQICLVDPTLDEPGLPGDRATEPEINTSSQAGRGEARDRGGRRGR